MRSNLPRSLSVLGLLALSGSAIGCDHDAHRDEHASHGDDHASHGKAPAPASPTTPPANEVQAEMRLLSEALEAAVRGIGAGDVRGVEHALHRVHAAKEKTAAALASARYRPPKNADRLPRFRELDEAFHGRLEPLVEASRANDVPRTAQALGAALESCHGCHTEFRL